MAVPELVTNATDYWQNREPGGKQESKAGPALTGQKRRKSEKPDRMIMSAIINHTDRCPDSDRRALALRIR